jgi:D-hydroxyproline dehydrogenase subunit beta
MAQPGHYAVVGAGVLGAALATWLARRGARVTLLDADVPGRATTRSSLAWLNANEKLPRDYHHLNHAGMRAWARWAETLGGDAWFRPVGNLEWALSERGRADLAARVRRLIGWGYPARLVTAESAAELEPAVRPPREVTELAWFPGEGYLEPEPLVDRLVAAAAERGATVLTGPPGRVVGFDTADGAVRAVRTADGPVPVDGVVCCAGRWTPALAGLFDPRLPVPLVPWQSPGATAPGLVVLAGPVGAPAPRRLLHTPEVCLRPAPGDAVHLEALDAAVDLHTPDRDLDSWAAELLDRARRAVPALRDARVLDRRVCVRPMPVDGHPVVGPIPGVAGGYLMVTHSGATLAAHLAELVTAELLDGGPRPELEPYRPDRFATAAVASD